MDKSEKLNDLFSALSKFQGELENATKDVDKPGITWKYADLAGCINTAKPHLLGNSLAVTQLMGMSDQNKQTIITMLTHSSGQYISSEVELPVAVLNGASGKNPVQALGSAITYMRRYCYAAIIGMAQEDDDGVSTNQSSSTKQQTPKSQEDDKPWYNEPDYQADLIGITKAIRGGSSIQSIVDQISQKYKISNKYRDMIKAI